MTATLSVWCERRGTGPPIVLLPGGPGMAADYLEPLADLLVDSFSVTLVDPPGCGRSAATGPIDVDGLIAELERVRAALHIDRWIVGGHSSGADLALAYALDVPERTRAVLAIAPTGIQDDRSWHRAVEQGRAADLDQVPTSAYPVDPEIHREMLASWRRRIRRPDLLRRLAELPAPYRAVIGSDEIRPSWPVEQVVRLVPAGHLVVLDGAGHCPWWTHRSELREAILEMRAS